MLCPMPNMKQRKVYQLQELLALWKGFLKSFPASADVAVHALRSLF